MDLTLDERAEVAAQEEYDRAMSLGFKTSDQDADVYRRRARRNATQASKPFSIDVIHAHFMVFERITYAEVRVATVTDSEGNIIDVRRDENGRGERSLRHIYSDMLSE